MQRRHFLQLAALAASLAQVHRGRAAASKPATSGARVLIVGGGFAGAACARQLRLLDPAIAVTVIDPSPDYVTGPMSNSVIAGLRSLASISVSRTGLAHHGVRVLQDRVDTIDAPRQRIGLASGRQLDYDRLVVAPGIRLLWDSPAGYDEAAAARMPHAWLPGDQTALLAAQLRTLPNGGVVAISVPGGLMRCPPGPYERASLIAFYLKRHKPRAKLLIFDSNNHMPRQDLFSEAWQALYPGLIEWLPATADGTVVRVDAARMTLYTASGAAHRVDVANVIPAQAPGQLAFDAGLATGHGWCPVEAGTFASTLQRNIHVIGDACIAGPMPKSASAAVSQAHSCAAAIVAALAQRSVVAPQLNSVCYSMLAPDHAIAIRAAFALDGDQIRTLPAADADAAEPASLQRLHQAAEAQRWYRAVMQQTFDA